MVHKEVLLESAVKESITQHYIVQKTLEHLSCLLNERNITSLFHYIIHKSLQDDDKIPQQLTKVLRILH